MCEQAKAEPLTGESGGGAPWYPLRQWWQPSWFFNPDAGLPPFLDPRDPRWMDVVRLQRSLAASPWPGFLPPPLFVPYIAGSMRHPGQESGEEQYKWRVNLDVADFSPSEISLSVAGGFLEVAGKHEEKPDKHGFIARCFTRKYRLPAEVAAAQVVSSLSVDGVLTVEAPVPGSCAPAAVLIPVKVEVDKEREENTLDTDPEGPELPPAEAESPSEVRGDEAHPGSSTAGPPQHEERREQEEETHEKPAGESHPPVPADGEGAESLLDSPKNREAAESQEGPDTSQPPEHKEPAVDGEKQIMAGSGEAAEEIAQPGEPETGKSPPSGAPSQELEAPEQHTE